MIMTRSRDGSRDSSRGGVPVRSGGSPVRRGASPVSSCPVVPLLVAVVVMMMIGLLLLLFLFANRVVGCRRHRPRRSLLLSPIRLPVVGL